MAAPLTWFRLLKFEYVIVLLDPNWLPAPTITLFEFVLYFLSNIGC